MQIDVEIIGGADGMGCRLPSDSKLPRVGESFSIQRGKSGMPEYYTVDSVHWTVRVGDYGFADYAIATITLQPDA